MPSKQYAILVVDDEQMVCSLLRDIFLRDGYQVYTASDGVEALAVLADVPVDMVVADIKMPNMDGFALFDRMNVLYPHTKRVLMTAGDIDEYLSLVRERNIGNVLSKGGEFHIDEIRRYVRSLLTGDVFGLEKSFPAEAIRRQKVRSRKQARAICSEVVREYGTHDGVYLEMAMNELISNAVYHGVLQLSGLAREKWDENYALADDRAISVSWARDERKVGVAVEDPMGNLTKVDALRWLDHPLQEELHEEEHGRGLLLVRRLIDRFIINIDPGRRTECILIQYMDRSLSREKKPLLIHEV